MKYFTIKCSSETTIIGNEYPQIQTMGGSVNRSDDDSLYNVYPDTFPNFIPNLDYFVLHRNAKVSDILSASMISYGYIVNGRVLEILKKHHLPEHRFFPAVVRQNDKVYEDYAWFFYVCDVFDYIDYSKTEFYICDLLDSKVDDCTILSANNLRNLKEVLPNDRDVKSDLLYFKKNLGNMFDLFKISFGSYKTFISERLKDSLEQKKISGFKIVPTENIKIVDG